MFSPEAAAPCQAGGATSDAAPRLSAQVVEQQHRRVCFRANFLNRPHPLRSPPHLLFAPPPLPAHLQSQTNPLLPMHLGPPSTPRRHLEGAAAGGAALIMSAAEIPGELQHCRLTSSCFPACFFHIVASAALSPSLERREGGGWGRWGEGGLVPAEGAECTASV